MEKPDFAPMRTAPPSITVQLTPEDFDSIHQFAHRCGTSPAQLMKIGIFRLMAQAVRGEVAMLPEDRAGVQSGNA